MSSKEHRSRSRIKQVLHRMSDAFLLLDDDGVVTYCNDTAENVLGRSKETLAGTSLWETFPDAVDTPLYERCQRALDEGTRQTFETEIPPLDARLSVRIYPTSEGLSIYFEDVSLRRRREAELSRYTTVIEAVSDGVLVIGENGTITMVNEAVEELFDANRGRLIGQPVALLQSVTKLTSDDVARIGDAIKAVKTDGADERTVQLELPGDEGNPRIAELKLVPLPGATDQSVTGVIRDVTEREERERIITALHGATRHLFQAEELPDICAAAVHTGADLLDLQISGIFLLDEEINRLEPVAATAGAHDMFGGLPTFAENEGLVWKVFRDGEGVFFEDLSKKDGTYNPNTPIRSELIVPIGERGVLMAGETHPGAFDETDLELAEILAENTNVALERAQREQLLRQRTDELERQADRLDTVARLLSGPIDDALDNAAVTADSTTQSAIDEGQAFIEDARYIAGSGVETGSKKTVPLSIVVDRAQALVDDPPEVEVVENAEFRGFPDSIERLFVAFMRIVDRRADTEAEVGIIEEASEFRGFYIEDNAPPLPPADREPSIDTIDPDQRIAIELAIARQIADSHDWRFELRPTTKGMMIAVTEVTTLRGTDDD